MSRRGGGGDGEAEAAVRYALHCMGDKPCHSPLQSQKGFCTKRDQSIANENFCREISFSMNSHDFHYEFQMLPFLFFAFAFRRQNQANNLLRKKTSFEKLNW